MRNITTATALPLPRVREMVRAAGAEISGRYGHAAWEVKGIGHERRARTIGETLCAIPGVLQADASSAGTVRVEFDRERITESAIVDALAGLGLKRPKQLTTDDHADHDQHRQHGQDPDPAQRPGPGGVEEHPVVRGHRRTAIRFWTCPASRAKISGWRM